jgi:hypothetical protein
MSNKLNSAKYFDIYDKDVTPEIYTLLFSGELKELTGNDTWYSINPFKRKLRTESKSYSKSSEEVFKAQLERGWNNTYPDQTAMRHLCENPITCEEALNRFKQWLTERGVTPEDKLFVAIWW